MLRLRTTATLSLLALGVGIAGTQWLSDQTGSRFEPMAVHAPDRAIAPHEAVRRVARRVHAVSRRPSSIDSSTYYAVTPAVASITPVASRSDAIQWVPVSMPVSSIPFTRIRHHDVGYLVLHLIVDGQGRVAQATLAQSSGDDVLDANALVIARQWRFAVPPDHPYGFSGDLPLSFNAPSAQLAQAP